MLHDRSGRVQRRVHDILTAQPGATLTVADIAGHVYPGKPYTAARREAVRRAVNALAPTLGWVKRRKDWGGPVRYMGPDAVAADKAARAKFMQTGAL
jgi:hypothetical protein